MMNEEFREDFSKCFIGLGIALFASVLALWEVSLDNKTAQRVQMQEDARQNMSEGDLRTMREKMLGRFGTTPPPSQ